MDNDAIYDINDLGDNKKFFCRVGVSILYDKLDIFWQFREKCNGDGEVKQSSTLDWIRAKVTKTKKSKKKDKKEREKIRKKRVVIANLLEVLTVGANQEREKRSVKI